MSERVLQNHVQFITDRPRTGKRSGTEQRSPSRSTRTEYELEHRSCNSSGSPTTALEGKPPDVRATVQPKLLLYPQATSGSFPVSGEYPTLSADGAKNGPNAVCADLIIYGALSFAAATDLDQRAEIFEGGNQQITEYFNGIYNQDQAQHDRPSFRPTPSKTSNQNGKFEFLRHTQTASVTRPF